MNLSKGKGRVIAVDISHMSEIPGVEVIKGDFLSEGVRRKVEELVGGLGVDTVLSDMMAPMSGVRGRDVQASLDLCTAALEFGRGVLRVDVEDEMGEKGNAEGASTENEADREQVERKLLVVEKGRNFYPGGNMM